uniref:CAP10 domain-containing protein n=1 Tax=Macrostomum lignano TaxID=282301 RepID=A0A1I8IDU7_9PLAT
VGGGEELPDGEGDVGTDGEVDDALVTPLDVTLPFVPIVSLAALVTVFALEPVLPVDKTVADAAAFEYRGCGAALDFLEAVDHKPILNSDAVLDRALHRYETMWLPLLWSNKDSCRLMKPPFDMAWIAHCHQLAPRCYRSDVINLIGFVPDTQSPTPDTVSDELSRKLWSSAHPSEPFDLDLTAVAAAAPVDGAGSGFAKSRLTYDIRGAAQRQRGFFYNVSLPHYRDSQFLQASLRRYKQFLRLQQLCPQEFLVPCYDIDLMWHSHQLTPLAYERDCLRLLNRVLSHDDNVGDRSDGSRLSKAYARTAELWLQHFGQSYARSGCMYRGESPAGRLSKFNLSCLHSGCQRRYQLSLTRMELTAPPTIDRYKVVLLAPKLPPCKPGKRRRLVAMTQAQGTVVESPVTVFDYLVNGDGDQPLLLELIDKRKSSTGLCGCGGTMLGNCKVAVSDSIKQLPPTEPVYKLVCDASFSYEAPNYGISNFAAELTFSSNVPCIFDCNLRLVPGDWVVAIMPTDVPSLWGPVPLGQVPQGQEHRCIVASHSLVTESSQLVFTVRVIHSQQLGQSVVQVFNGDSMVTVAYMIGVDQLPTPSQITTAKRGPPSLNPGVRQRAFIIKDAAGDWGLLLGNWTGRRRGVPATPMTPPIRGSPGYLDLILHNLSPDTSGNTSHRMRLPNSDSSDQHVFDLGGIYVDLSRGSACIDAQCRSAPQLVAAAFCAATLEAMCQPLPPAAATATGQLADSVDCQNSQVANAAQNLGEKIRVIGSPKLQSLVTHPTTTVTRGRATVRRVDPYSVAFCQATGVLYLDWMPLRWHWHCGHWWQRARQGSGSSGGSGHSFGCEADAVGLATIVATGGFDDLQQSMAAVAAAEEAVAEEAVAEEVVAEEAVAEAVAEADRYTACTSLL